MEVSFINLLSRQVDLEFGGGVRVLAEACFRGNAGFARNKHVGIGV